MTAITVEDVLEAFDVIEESAEKDYEYLVSADSDRLTSALVLMRAYLAAQPGPGKADWKPCVDGDAIASTRNANLLTVRDDGATLFAWRGSIEWTEIGLPDDVRLHRIRI